MIQSCHSLTFDNVNYGGYIGWSAGSAQLPLVFIDGKSDLQQIQRMKDAGGNDATTDNLNMPL